MMCQACAMPAFSSGAEIVTVTVALNNILGLLWWKIELNGVIVCWFPYQIMPFAKLPKTKMEKPIIDTCHGSVLLFVQPYEPKPLPFWPAFYKLEFTYQVASSFLRFSL
jgi:hypothetical protein